MTDINDVPEPNPLAALIGPFRVLRFCLRGLALVFAAGSFAVLGGGGGWLSGAILSTGFPILPGGEIPIGEEREFLLSGIHWGPPVLFGGFAICLASLLLGRLLLGLFASQFQRPREVMIDDFRKRVREQASPRPPTRSFGRRAARAAFFLACVIASWFAGSAFLDIDPVPYSLGSFLERAAGTVVGFLLLVAMWIFGYLLWMTSDFALPYFCKPLGITASEVEALQRTAREDAKAIALQQWPPHVGAELRLNTATSIFGSDPPRPRRWCERQLRVPWARKATSVETLAATLLTTAVLECRERGYLDYQVVGRKRYIRANLPEDILPEGLAKVVLGHHHVGLDPGRTVNGTIRQTIGSWLPRGDEDPHWKVIETALSDLEAASIVEKGTIDVSRLRQAFAILPENHRAESLAGNDPVLTKTVIAEFDRALRKMRILETGESALAKLLGFLTNYFARRGHQLPHA